MLRRRAARDWSCSTRSACNAGAGRKASRSADSSAEGIADSDSENHSPPNPAPKPRPVEKPVAETPKIPAPKAGGGPIGGKGTDVATVQTEGIDFPFPGYLNNIVRQIALRFNPGDANSGLRAEVRFVIRRDGSVIGIGFVTRSGNYAFDLEAQGAVEAAAREFGPLPEGFHDDALPVVFSFDPRFIK